jgi:hypothetical protein
MKYPIMMLFAMLLLTGCEKKDSTKNLHITGNVKGLMKGTLYIQKIVDTSLVAIDTIVIDGNSEFASNLDIRSPEMYYLFLDRGVTNSLDNNLPFFAEPGNIRIETQLDRFLSGAKITGSKNNDKYQEFKKVKMRFTDQNLMLMEQKLNAFKDTNTGIIDSIEALQNANLKRLYLYTTNFALTNKDLELAPYLALAEIPDINIKYLDTIQKSMTPEVSKSYYGKKLIDYYRQRQSDEKK